MQALLLFLTAAVCCISAIDAGCCTESFVYCGKTLEHERTGKCNVPLIANALYKCVEKGDPVLQKQCDDHCKNNVNISILSLVAYGAENIIPALQVAAKDSNDVYAPFLHFHQTIHGRRKGGDYCESFTAAISQYLGKFYYTERSAKSYLLILPTGCSSAINYAADMAREWNVPIISSAGSGSELRDKQRYPSLVCILPSKTEEYAAAFLELLRWYNWRQIVFVCDEDKTTDQAACHNFPAVLWRQMDYYSVYEFTEDLQQADRRVAALVRARTRGRVIVILAHMDVVRLTLVAAYRMGMTTDKFVFITSLWYNSSNPILGLPHWYRNDSLDQDAKLAYQALLIITMPGLTKNDPLLDFIDAVNQRSLQQNITFDTSASNAKSAEETKIYAVYAYVTFRSAAQMINESLANGQDLSDGIGFAHRMYNRSFTWLEQAPFKVNDNGDRDGVYAVLAFDAHSQNMEEILRYDALNGWDELYQSPSGHVWIRNATVWSGTFDSCSLLDDQQQCGTDDDFILAEVLPSILLTVTAGIFVVHQCRKRHNWEWKTSQWNLSAIHLQPPCSKRKRSTQ
ncbi:hypothetical protein BV898_08617 [Hypsibius exemplaris]|uniref:Receptor ligand binding region domain-containing protein n=1 Tax=Hypsibius exemplaris TaxID=2072580 RepID=A0A1W0WPV6_HYPEX|nr:hypothetical protein BV898_08617 [Hypsibius exemplaris]